MSTSSGSSSSRTRFETAGFDLPTRSASVAERQTELVEHDREGARLLDRREILARDVLDEAEQQGVAVVGFADDGRHRLQLRVTRRAPAPLTCDQLIAAGSSWTDEHRLDDALRADRVRQPCAGIRVEASSRLPRVRVDRVDGQLGELGLRRAAEQDFQAPSEASSSQARSTSSIATFQ